MRHVAVMDAPPTGQPQKQLRTGFSRSTLDLSTFPSISSENNLKETNSGLNDKKTGWIKIKAEQKSLSS